jgi:NitT/TauT family transport system ATP-binding protein
LLELESVSIAYRVDRGRFLAVEGASALFPEGEISAIIGPSGSGKTSLLEAMAGLLAPESGRVLVSGQPLSGVRERSSVIFQDYGLLPWKTVADNAELPLRIRRVRARERHERVRPVLEELGLSDFGSFYPARLSGGMRQRVAVARALATDPDLLLMDEPFSSLDAITREGLQDLLLSVMRRRRMTSVIVTHSIEEAAFLADRVYVMGGRAPGRVAGLISWDGGGREGSGSPRASRDRAPRDGQYRESGEYFSRCAELRALLNRATRQEAQS